MLAVSLAALAGEDRRARFVQLYTAHEQRVFRTALARLGDRGRAEEAAQESWLRVAAAFERVSALEEESVAGYLTVLVRNVCCDLQRREGRTEPFPENWDAPAPKSRNEDALRRITALIRALPPAYRALLERKYVLGYTNREIGRQLGMKESTVATRLQRGRRLLADALRKEGYDETGWVL